MYVAMCKIGSRSSIDLIHRPEHPPIRCTSPTPVADRSRQKRPMVCPGLCKNRPSVTRLMYAHRHPEEGTRCTDRDVRRCTICYHLHFLYRKMLIRHDRRAWRYDQRSTIEGQYRQLTDNDHVPTVSVAIEKVMTEKY